MTTIETVKTQLEKAERINHLVERLEDAKNNLSQVNLHSIVIDKAHVEVLTDGISRECYFFIGVHELEVLLQNTVNILQKELDELLADF